MPPLAVSGIPAKRILPSKESGLFKELLTLYETKQLKKGLKTADTILKKFPEHGETLCMKGLILTHLGKREEGVDLVKKGIRLDLTSHICWHVFGLIQKAEKNYEEALKSYTQALKFDRENLNILRDTASLQTQLRLYEPLLETRHTLLKLRPQVRSNWVSLAVAYHLNGNLVEAKKVLEQYERTLKNVPDYDVEHSEVLLYHVRVLEELGEYAEAIALLDVNAKERAIVDRVSIMEYRARLLSKLGKTEEAEHAWRALIDQNPDGYDYYRGLLSNTGVDLDHLTDETRSKALQTLKGLSEQIPRAAAARRSALNVAMGDEFQELAKTYLTSRLTKGIPSLFVDVKALYVDIEKRQIIEDTVESLRQTNAPVSPPPSSESEPPTTYLWSLYFLAQHYSFLSQHSKALALLDEALTHTPTLPELYLQKGRVLKRAGDLVGAAGCVEEARQLDGQDRYLNTKCAKYRLRAGMVQEASEILGMFTKKDAPSPGADLEDMQSLFYLVEEGDAHRRNGNLGMALKRYTAVQKVFDEIEDDQYDFHGYSLRKFTLSIYVDLVTWEDQLRSHPAYVHAAISAAQIYVRLHDEPSLCKGTSAPATLTDAEKKAKKKAKKAAQKVAEEAKKAVASSNSMEDRGLEPPPPKDDDPDGSKLLAASDPLERAAKLLAPLPTSAKRNIEAWIAIYDVAVRRNKFLQAVRALNHATSIDPEHPELHVRIIDFNRRAHPVASTLAAPVGPAVALAYASLLPDGLSIDTYASQYVQKHSTSPRAIAAAATVSRNLGASHEEVEGLIFGLLKDEVQLDIKTATEALTFLKDIQSSRSEEFRAACDSKFGLSTVFRTPSELSALRKKEVDGHLTVEDTEKAEVLNG